MPGVARVLLMFESDRTEDEIEEQLGLAVDNQAIWPGMSYSDGVQAALRWVLGEQDEGPMDDI